MAIWSFEGSQGSSKSTSAVALIVEEHLMTGRKVVSNNHLNEIPYTHFDLQWFLENMAGENQELQDCILFLDEAYQYMDSRLSQSKISRLFTYFIVQTRKRGVDLYICTHHIENVDVRLRRAIDVRGACSYFAEVPCKQCKGKGTLNGNGTVCPRCYGYGETGLGRIHFLRVRGRSGQPLYLLGNTVTKRRFSVDISPASKYWKYFSTKERMPIQQKLLQSIETAEVM